MCRVDSIISFHAATMLSTLQRIVWWRVCEREKDRARERERGGGEREEKKIPGLLKELLKIYKCLPGSNLLTYPDRLFLISFSMHILREYLISNNNFFLPVLSNSPSSHYSKIVYNLAS